MALPSMTVGGVEVQGLSDGTLPTSIDKVVDMTPAQVEQLVGRTDNGTFHIPVNNFLIRRDGKDDHDRRRRRQYDVSDARPAAR